MEQTKTKKALIMSVLSMVLCIAMLIGMTFAWFTDTASTGVNKIQAGNLKVGLEYKDANGDWKPVGNTIDFVKAAGHTDEEILWEPGCTYKLPQLRVINNGNLALKYKVVISGFAGDTKLAEALEWKCNGAELTNSADMTLCENETLTTKGANKEFAIEAHMKEAAGNEYQNLTMTGVTITVYATQLAHESDSKDNTYDENATYPVGSESTLKDALATGGTVTVGTDIKTNGADTIDARTIINNPTTLNLDKKIISPDNMGNNNTNFVALIVDADTTINAGASGGIDTGNNGGYAINVRNGANLTINGGTYYGGGTAVQVQKGTLTITGGHFAVEPYSDPTYGYNFLLNCIDSNYKNGTAKIIVKGGTFVNFDPSNNTAEGARTNFVAEGYKVVTETHDSDTWYKVVKK